MSTIADRIKAGMSIRGLRQTDIIEKTGINKGALSSYISGRYEPKQNNIYLIAKALNVNEAWLMGADVPMDRDPSLKNLLDKRLSELQLSLTEVAEKSEVPLHWLKNIDSFIPGQLGDYEIGYTWITRVADTLSMPGNILRSALARQEIPLPDKIDTPNAKDVFSVDSSLTTSPKRDAEFTPEIRAAARGMMDLSPEDQKTAIDMINYLSQKGREVKNIENTKIRPL